MMFRAVTPPEEDVTGGLHAPVAIDDALPAVRKDTPAGVWFEDRGPRFFDLKKQGIAIAGREEKHPAPGSDAANPDNLDRHVIELVAIKQSLVGRRQRGAVPGQRVPRHL